MILAINKPKGPTSHDVVDSIREITGKQKVGHAGTLDPLASGVLVIAIGREDTKKLSSIVNKEKEYVATIELGKTSATDDAEGDLTSIQVDVIPTQNEIRACLENFVGNIEQIPPVYSSIKIKGTPAHRRVRKGENVSLKPRNVEVIHIKLEQYEWPYLKLRIITGPGVYIRAMARDIGEMLNTGGVLKELERVRVGEYTIETAITLDALKNDATLLT